MAMTVHGVDIAICVYIHNTVYLVCMSRVIILSHYSCFGDEFLLRAVHCMICIYRHLSTIYRIVVFTSYTYIYGAISLPLYRHTAAEDVAC